MIILRQIEYAKTEADLDKRIRNNSFTFIKEIIKYLTMSCSSKITDDNLSHWCDVAVAQLNDLEGDRAIKLFLGLVDNYKNLPRKRYTRDFVLSLRDNLATSSDYIKVVRDFIYNEKARGVNKYQEALKTGASLTEEDIIQMCKFAALCLTGQLNPDYDNWYDNKVKTTQVNWDKSIGFVPSRRLREILKTITGY